MTYKELDLESWERRDHFNFFKNFDDPFFGIVFNVDCSIVRKISKQENVSLFLIYLYLSLKAANETEPFRYRLLESTIAVYDKVNASPTINRKDGSFGFAYFDYDTNFSTFYKNAKIEIENIQKTKGLKPATNNENVIHYSTLPWISFSGLKYATYKAKQDSIPKITFGKIFKQQNKNLLPVSVSVNHALMDGYHVGLFSERFQNLLNSFVF